MLKLSLKAVSVGCVAYSSSLQAADVDIFLTGGQSNAEWNSYAWYQGVSDEITSSGLYSNPVVLQTSHSGRPFGDWFNDGVAEIHYQADFFNDSGTGVLQSKINEIIAAGDTPRFKGLFWFQGEADAKGKDSGSVVLYPSRWSDMLDELDSDLGYSDWNYLMNTVGRIDAGENTGEEINATFKEITDNDSRGVLFETQSLPYKTAPEDIHGYDHNLVGTDNVTLFNATFVPEPSTALLSLMSFGFLALRRRR